MKKSNKFHYLYLIVARGSAISVKSSRGETREWKCRRRSMALVPFDSWDGVNVPRRNL